MHLNDLSCNICFVKIIKLMKKILPLFAILFSVFGFSQAITVSSTTYTVPQLVNNVLINSPCVSATNVTWSTGTNFGSSNGIGFFQNSNVNFPMQAGVILSTGNALNSPGPNTSMLNDGSTSWTGDANLESTLAAAGIPMVSKNATVLEFDFTPISPNFSFDFVFASEEYGNFQCQYSDAFAFLLTNMNTGVTTNLAVVPNTNIPISVITIRDFLYNSSCASANAQYFGTFNGGSNAGSAAINFNGQTQMLTAASPLTPGVPYHIKLVIADRLDQQSDSSIFISSDSFNIGQDVLGQDLTIANSTALCFGTNHTLNSGLSTINYSFTWSNGGNIIPGETGSSLNITQPGVYGVTYTNLFSSCDPVTDSIVIEYFPQITSANPNTLYKCDTGATTYNFNLDLNTPIVKAGLNALTTVTYFTNLSDANSNINPLPLSYTSASGQTIYVRIQLPNSNCFIIKTFQLLVTPGPVANQAQNLVQCARSVALNNAFFNLGLQTASVLNGQSAAINIVSYYTSLNNANNATNPITNTTNPIFGNQTIYVRVQNISDPECFSISNFNLIVNPAPIVDIIQNVTVCNSYVLQTLTNGNYFTGINGTGTPLFAGNVITTSQTIYIFNQPGGTNSCSSNSSFRITIIDPNTITPSDVTMCGSFTLPQPTFGNYYTGPAASGSQIPFGTVISVSQVVYYYFMTPDAPFCVIDSDFNVTIIPSIEVGTRLDVFDCSSYILPSLSIGNYFTGPGGTGTQITSGTTISSNQTVYVYASTTGTSPCSDEDNFNIFIGVTAPANISQCNGFTLPVLPIGNYFTASMGSGTLIPSGTIINESTIVYIYIPTSGNSTSNCTDNLYFTISIAQPPVDTIINQSVCESFTLPPLTNGSYFTGPNATGTILNAGDVIITTQTIYINAVLNASCSNQSSFTVTILGAPQIDSRSDIDICDMYVLTALTYGNYYTGPNGTGTILPSGTVITSSQLIYIYVVSTGTPSCIAQNSFQINIFSAQADTLQNVTICNSFILPSLSLNNKYYNLSGGPNGGGTELLPGSNITTSQTIYIFKENIIRTSFSCFNETSFTITINNTPVLTPSENQAACNSFALPALIVGNYYSGPYGTGNLLNAGTIITSSQLVYVFAQTNTTPNCTVEDSFTITIFNVDDQPNVIICESYVLPILTIGKYYTGSNGTGTMLPAGTVITASQTIYIYALAPFSPACNDESSFTITVIDTPVAYSVPVILRTICDEDGNNDGIVNYNLAVLSASILGTQTGSEFTIAYYESFAEATTASNPVTSSTLSTIYVRVSNTLTPSCFDVKPITIIVNKIPEPTPVDGIVCIDSETGALLNAYTLLSGLNAATHTFLWTNETGDIVGYESNYSAILPGVYTIIATRIATGCASLPTTATVNPSEPATVAYTVSDDFADNQVITVQTTGVGGDYEYQLDNGEFQNSPIFTNVNSGIHIITVRDKNGCGVTTAEALVINYPKFFTPNADGYNDTWNIHDLSNQPSANIYIFDRYGKLIRQIKPSGEGWDGNINGSTMPSTDYWFTVTYVDENQINREFKAHFAMKR